MSTNTDYRTSNQSSSNTSVSTPPSTRKNGSLNSRSFSPQNDNNEEVTPQAIKNYIQKSKATNEELRNQIQRLEAEKIQKQEEIDDLRTRITTLEQSQTALTNSIQNLSEIIPLANSILSDKKVSASNEIPVGQDPVDKRSALQKRIAVKVENLQTTLLIPFSVEKNLVHLQFYVGKFNKFKKELIDQEILQEILGNNRTPSTDPDIIIVNETTRAIFNRCMVNLGQMSDLLKDLLIKANPNDSRLPATGLVTPLFRTYTSARIFKMPGGDQPFQATKDTLQVPSDWIYEESHAEDPKALESKNENDSIVPKQDPGPNDQPKDPNDNAN